ncbi:hypothetical protein AKO1_015770 [Acrasis kona]|uniref:Uncharacterized protein n=1 Tax=Acrasis kona TaxID=1008807 RepID=A0AAW2ZGH3_9EUKA
MKLILALFIVVLLAVTLYAQDVENLEGMEEMEKENTLFAVANDVRPQSVQVQEQFYGNVLSAFEQQLSSNSEQEDDQVEMDAGDDDFDQNSD